MNLQEHPPSPMLLVFAGSQELGMPPGPTHRRTGGPRLGVLALLAIVVASLVVFTITAVVRPSSQQAPIARDLMQRSPSCSHGGPGGDHRHATLVLVGHWPR